MKEALEKSERFRAWQAREVEELIGPVEEAWPTFSEYELIEEQARDLAVKVGIVSSGFETQEMYLNRYAGGTRKAYQEGRLKADPGDSSSPYRRLLADEAEATNIWLRHVLDFLRLLERAIKAAEDTSETVSEMRAKTDSCSVILFASASPADLDRLRIDVEIREIKDELRRSERRDLLRLEARGACRPTDFVRELLNVSPQIVHFSGHGSKSGALYFENERGESLPASVSAVSVLFERCSEFVKCVILNACFSEVQAKAIRMHIPLVIGMRAEIEDKTAIAFSKAFYLALASCRNEEIAFRLATATLELEGLAGADIPILVP